MDPANTVVMTQPIAPQVMNWTRNIVSESKKDDDVEGGGGTPEGE